MPEQRPDSSETPGDTADVIRWAIENEHPQTVQPNPKSGGLFESPTKPKQRSSKLFPAATTMPAPTKPPAPRPPRWRDEDMPLRPRDVLAVGLTNRRAVIGRVTGVNDHVFRLDGYSPRLDRFNAGVIVIGWQQVVEFGPVARKRGDYSLNMDPLVEFQRQWTEEGQ